MACISFRDEKFMFAPDVQGPMSPRPLQVILEEKPQLLMIGGPPTYLVPSRVSDKQLQLSLRNLSEIARNIPHIILDHHILRDADWQQKTVETLYETYNAGSVLQTAAEFAGRKNAYLETNRKSLFAENPPQEEFKKWMKLPEEKKKLTPPPT
jgi:predicted metallo-beta-lactamase superfamily hydrolase